MKKELSVEEARKTLDRIRNYSLHIGPVVTEALAQMGEEIDVSVNIERAVYKAEKGRTEYRMENFGPVEMEELWQELAAKDYGHSVEELIMTVSGGKYTNKGIIQNPGYFRLRRVAVNNNHSGRR